MEIIKEAERVAGEDIWSLMQFTENFRRQYGKEPRPMELILKKLYLRRMAADIGVTRIYSSGKTVFMKTNMNKKVFKMMTESMTSDIYKDSLVLEGDQIKVTFSFRFSISLVSDHRLSLVFCLSILFRHKILFFHLQRHYYTKYWLVYIVFFFLVENSVSGQRTDKYI